MRQIAAISILLLSSLAFGEAPFGFKWGSSKQEVFKHAPLRLPCRFSDGLDLCQVTLKSTPFNDLYYIETAFRDGLGLSQIQIGFGPYEEHEGLVSIAKYHELNDLLTKKYGKPLEANEDEAVMQKCLSGSYCTGWRNFYMTPDLSAIMSSVMYLPPSRAWLVTIGYRSLSENEDLLEKKTDSQKAKLDSL